MYAPGARTPRAASQMQFLEKSWLTFAFGRVEGGTEQHTTDTQVAEWQEVRARTDLPVLPCEHSMTGPLLHEQQERLDNRRPQWKDCLGARQDRRCALSVTMHCWGGLSSGPVKWLSG